MTSVGSKSTSLGNVIQLELEAPFTYQLTELGPEWMKDEGQHTIFNHTGHTSGPWRQGTAVPTLLSQVLLGKLPETDNKEL